MDNPNYYAIIPASVRYDTRLSFGEKVMYGEITALSQKDGYCFASNAYFADLYQLTKSTISRWVSNLQDCGYVKVDLVKDSKGAIEMRRIIINANLDLYAKLSIGYTQNPQEGMCKNRKGNITSINTTRVNNTPISPKGDCTSDINDLFDRFWRAYPKRKAKESALKAFKKIKPDEPLLMDMLNAIARQLDMHDWKKSNGQYIPYPATWLNQHRWEDEDSAPSTDGENQPAYLSTYL